MIANLTNNLIACSGFLTSARELQVFTTPITKNKTNNASPIACTAPFILSITCHIVPPLNASGDCVIICHISLNLSFQVSIAFSKLFTTQLPLANINIFTPPNNK